MNPIKKLEEIKKELSLFFIETSVYIEEAIAYYKSACHGLVHYDVNSIMDVIRIADKMKYVLFDALVLYMTDSNNPIDRRLLVEKEVKRFIKMNDVDKVKSIVDNPIYQNRFHYVWGKK